ncbi:MAG: hypothetical protein R3223_02635 [Longimicrobiales bacterium]|nr:hypothetical protein [Longimicrobiales bacterium]
MRADFPPPPDPSRELVRLTPHEIVRRFPETLRVFRRHGVDLRERGVLPLEELAEELVEERGEEAGRLLIREIRRALDWRSPSGA